MDKLAVIVDEIMRAELATKSAEARVYNLVKPHPTSWECLLGVLQRGLGLGEWWRGGVFEGMDR